MRFVRSLLMIVAACTLPGCRSTNVLFSDTQRVPHPDAGVVSIVYDRYGSLYPSENVHVDAAALRTARGPDLLRLEGYFRKEHANQTPVWRALVAEAPTQSPGAATSFDTAWRDVQASLRSQVVQRIEGLALANRATPRPVIVLVHGFNNDREEALAWYEEARRLVRARKPEAVFLDVYWDGLVASGIPLNIWTRAQYNFPLVGLEFRRVLNTLDPRIPVRVLTHSSGGPLIASTLGDASCPLPGNDRDYQRYHQLVRDHTAPADTFCRTKGALRRRNVPADPALAGERESYRPPNPHDFRVGMIVPAASPNTFTSFTRGTDGPDRLIFGINSEDLANGKVFMSCRFRGTTCLSARPKLFCREVLPVFRGNPHTSVYLFDFNRSGVNRRAFWWWDAHNMRVYLQRDDMQRFLKLLLDDESADPGEEAQVCTGSQTTLPAT